MKVYLKCYKYLKGKNCIKTNSFVAINSQSIDLNNSQEENAEKKIYISHYRGKNGVDITLNKMSIFANCNFKQIKTLILSPNFQSMNIGNKRFFILSLFTESGATTLAFRLKKCIYCLPQVKQVTSLKLSDASKYFICIITLCAKFMLTTKLLKNFEAM